jgi:predicted acylesterase/phospholipase RssA
MSTTENYLSYTANSSRFVCATKGEASDIPVRFRSYDSDGPGFSTRRSTILQAARATSAAPGFFEPVVIDGFTFYDGGLRANNPSIEAWEEIRDVWKPRKDNVADIVSCFISIGCGNPGLQTIEKGAFKFLTESLANIATETKNTATRFHRANGELFRDKKCMRFNVEQGLQSVGLEEYKERNKIKNAAEEYIMDPTTIDNTYAVVKRLAQKQCMVDFA